jgi:hypothetical protein
MANNNRSTEVNAGEFSDVSVASLDRSLGEYTVWKGSLQVRPAFELESGRVSELRLVLQIYQGGKRVD